MKQSDDMIFCSYYGPLEVRRNLVTPRIAAPHQKKNSIGSAVEFPDSFE